MEQERKKRRDNELSCMSERCSYCGSTNVVTQAEHTSFCKDCRKSNVLKQDSEKEDFEEVCIIGLGYVGSSLAAVFSEKGIDVRGVDVNEEIIERINNGECPIEEDKITELFERAATEGRITATDSYDAVEGSDAIIVTVGTPLAKEDPDLSSVTAASKGLGRHLQGDDLVIFRSTLPAGATEDSIRPVLDEASGFTAGEDYSLAFCPERMAEGSAYQDMTTLPVVIGGLTDNCLDRAREFWSSIGNETVAVSSPRAAELTKLADNWWIDLNIALANEVALLSEQVGVDAMEVIHAANTLPKGEHNVNILFPGAGVGGSCLVKDPWFVANLGDSHGLTLQTPRVSRKINQQMPGHMVNLLEEGLGGFDGQTVAVLGYAFKSGTDDTRNTPSKEIVDSLANHDISIQITDPYVSSQTIEEEVGYSPVRLPEALDNADAVVIVTGHSQYTDLAASSLIDFVGDDDFVVIDGRFVFTPEEFANTNVKYLGVGRGDNV